VMIGGHCSCSSAHFLELIGLRQMVKVLEHAVVELVDDDARSVTRDQIGRDCSSQGDAWSSAGSGLEQDQAERIAACRYQQKVYGSVHRNEIVTMFVADELGARARETPSLGSIANNRQAITETFDGVGVIHDSSKMFLLGDPANKPEYN